MDIYPHLSIIALNALGLVAAPLYVYDFGTGRICWANEAALNLWQAVSAEELLSRDLGPNSPSTIARLGEYQEAFSIGEVREESWTFYPQGIPTPAICRCRGVSLDGHPRAMLVELRSSGHAALPAAELRAIEVVRHSPLMISLFDAGGRPLMRNPAAMTAFGKLDAASDPSANILARMFAQEDQYTRLVEGALAAPETLVQANATLAIEGWPEHSIVVTCITDPVSGSPAYLVTQQDITAQAALSRQLAATEEAFEAVLELNLSPTFVVDPSTGSILRANASAAGHFGTPKSVQTLFNAVENWESLRGMALSGESGSIEVRLKHRTGADFWAMASSARIRLHDTDALVVLLTDIDKLRQTASDLQMALETERLVTETQRRFLAIVTHDVRTPLALIDSAAQRLEKNAQNLTPERIQRKARRIRSSVQRLQNLLESTIERAAHQQGAMGYQAKPDDLNEVLVDITTAFCESRPELHIDLDIPDLPAVLIDRSLFEQAITNLLTNSIKFSPGSPKIHIRAGTRPDQVDLFVRDWGIGIPEEQREAVFSDYFRGNNVGSVPGTGLGLSIVRQIMSLHGGSIEVVETAGAGTTFKISIPRAMGA